jgi:hypothetical protein
MSRFSRIVIAAVLALPIAAIASAQAKKVQQSDLPDAVRATADKESAQGKVSGYWQRDQDGNTTYEVDLVVDGHARGVLINPEGAVVAVQDEVPFEKLDPGVQSGIKGQAGDGKVSKVFSITQNGEVKRYVAIVEKGDKKTTVQVGPDGGPVGATPANPANPANPPAHPANPPANPSNPPANPENPPNPPSR